MKNKNLETGITNGQLTIVDKSCGSLGRRSLHNRVEKPFEYEPAKKTEDIGSPEQYGTFYVEFEVTADIVKNSRSNIAWSIHKVVTEGMCEYLQPLRGHTSFGPFAIMKEKPKLKEDIWFYRLYRKFKCWLF